MEADALPPISPAALAKPWFGRLWLLLLLVVLIRLAVGLGLHWMAAQSGDPQPLKVLAQMLSAPDAYSYHITGKEVMEYWRYTYPEVGLGADGQWISRFGVLMGVLHTLIGMHPLATVFINALLALMVGYLAHDMALGLGQPPGRALWLAALICLWPSSLAWSSLPMKETLCLALEFFFLHQMLKLCLEPPRTAWSWVGEGAGLLFCFGLLSYVRFYMGYLLALTGLAALVAGLMPWAPQRPAWGDRARALGILLGAFVLFMPLIHEYPVFFYQGDLLPTAKPIGDRSPTSEPRVAERSLSSTLGGGMVDRMVDHRRVFATQGGSSIAPEAPTLTLPLRTQGLHTIWRVARDFFFFPYPWQRWPAGDHWTKVNLLVAAQMTLWYLLLPGIFWGLFLALRRHPVPGATLAAWGLGLGLVLAYVVLNRGTLFRFRDQAMLPLMLFFNPAPYWLLVPARFRAKKVR